MERELVLTDPYDNSSLDPSYERPAHRSLIELCFFGDVGLRRVAVSKIVSGKLLVAAAMWRNHAMNLLRRESTAPDRREYCPE